MNDEPDSEHIKKEGLVNTLNSKYKMQVKITHGGNYCQTASEEENNAESKVLKDLERLILDLSNKTKKIIGEINIFCPYLNDCDKNEVRNRKGIDANCFQKKSYHCKILLEKIGKDKFRDYLEEHKDEMTEEEFKENSDFALNFKYQNFL